jgi:hypothetical protein
MCLHSSGGKVEFINLDREVVVFFRSLLVALSLFLYVSAGVAAHVQTSGPQDTTQQQPGVQLPGHTRDLGQPENPPSELERERQKRANADRQLKLKHDTDQLLQLATQLKQAVDKSNEHTLSLEVVKKATEIEKLAKNIREKMRGY